MKNFPKRALTLGCSAALAVLAAPAAFAADKHYSVQNYKLLDLLNALVPTLIEILLVLGPIVIVVMCVQYITAEDGQGRAKAKKHIVDFVIGYIVVFFLIIAVNILTPNLILFADAMIEKGLAEGTLLG